MWLHLNTHLVVEGVAAYLVVEDLHPCRRLHAWLRKWKNKEKAHIVSGTFLFSSSFLKDFQKVVMGILFGEIS